MRKQLVFLMAVIILLAGLSLRFLGGAEAAPAAAIPEAQATPAVSTVWTANRITADTRSGALDLRNYTQSDVQITIVQSASINTTTVRLDRSNSGYDWGSGTTILNASGASTTVVVSSSLVGRYGSVYADVTNSNPVTITAILFNRP